jgi:hypothetical protein
VSTLNDDAQDLLGIICARKSRQQAAARAHDRTRFGAYLGLVGCGIDCAAHPSRCLKVRAGTHHRCRVAVQRPWPASTTSRPALGILCPVNLIGAVRQIGPRIDAQNT